ncbi:MAG: CHRD domain-containing protein [Runella slithyformis]|jgi:predicted small lipoprotein YifL|nr:MAG: CHRD domain-containing protein [Runella slithyformis]TAF27068.1 MAG: CHRD domain-containing protein [Runella slithyformis]TAF81006.1 MAG: CHRD domain-containing protein [Runella slithyformis]
MKKLIQALPILVALFTVGAMVACKDKGPHLNPEIKIEATIDGIQQTPRNSSTATGRMDGIYNKDTKTLTYTITYSGITPTAGHFHLGEYGVPNPVPAWDFGRNLTSPISGSWVLTQQQENALLVVNGIYVNLHTAAFKGGEIRGQLFASDLLALKK